MNPFKYSDDQISENELMIALPSMMIGVSVLSLPSELAKVTLFSDGWIPIILSGIIFISFAFLAAKLAAYFPGKQFVSYTSTLVTKPVAIALTFIHALIGIFLSALSIRSVSYISQQYLFEKTPIEVLALMFLLVVVYAVSGSRAGVFRLNVLFLPIILVTFIILTLLNIEWFELDNFLPMFQSSLKDYMKGIVKTYDVFVGFGIVLFYIHIIKEPKKVTKKVVIGVSIPVVFYMMIYLLSIGVFGNTVTGNLSYPMIELAKRTDIPGGIFARVESLFFTIWVMTIFNTVAIAFDVSVMLVTSIFQQINKKILTFILAPLIYYIAMFPQQVDQVTMLSNIMSQVVVYLTCIPLVILFLIAKIKGVNNRAKK